MTVQVGKPGDSAVEGEDYAAVADVTVTIPANALQGTGTFTLTPMQDTVAEGPETVSVEGEATGFMVTGTEVTLTDDDDRVRRDHADGLAGRGGGGRCRDAGDGDGDAGRRRTTLSESTTVTVQVGKSGDSAVEGTDYTDRIELVTVTIPANALQGTGTFTLTPMQDTIAEGDEKLSVRGDSTGYTVVPTAVTLKDDDAAPTQITPADVDAAPDRITLTVSPKNVSEGASTTTVTVTARLEGSVPSLKALSVTVEVGASGDSAVEGTDYANVPSFVLTIAEGVLEGTATFLLTPIQDTIAEGNEKLSVRGASTGYTVVPTAVTLIDDDRRPTRITLAVWPDKVAEDAAATTVTVTAWLVGGTTLPGPTQVRVRVGDRRDSATQGTDYEAVHDFTLTIPAIAHRGTAAFALTPIDDNVYEGTETVSVDGTASGFTVTGTKLSLTDDEKEPTEITLTVSPDRVAEDADATTVTVTARLQGSAVLPVPVPMTVRVGAPTDNATEGKDYRTVSDFNLTIPALSASGTATFLLIPIYDWIAEEEETVSIEGSATRFTVTGTEVAIDNAKTVGVPPLLARFARTVADQVMESVEGRRAASRWPGFEGRLAGRSIPGRNATPEGDAAARDRFEIFTDGYRTGSRWDPYWPAADPRGASGLRGAEPSSPAERDLVAGTSFSLTTGTPEEGLVSLWGRGSVTRFDGREDEYELDGEVASGALGADWTLGRGMAGLAIAHFRGKGGYRSPNTGGDAETALSMVYPYGRYAANERLSVWGVAGYGEGTFTVAPEDQSPMEADMNLAMAAVGGRGVLARAPGSGGVEHSATADAMVVHARSGSAPGLDAAHAGVTRLRLGLEGTWRGIEAAGGRFVPKLEIGVRHDGGDAETGFGADVGAELAWSDPERGIETSVQGRGLLTHEEEGFRERAVAGSLTWDPDPDSERGFGFTLDWTEGASATGGMDSLLSDGVPKHLTVNDDDDEVDRRLEARVGYGIPVLGTRFVGTPEIGFRLSDARREYALGWSLGLAGHDRMSFELSVEGTWREPEADDRAPERAVELGLRARW